jgi:hypothetical protein
MRGGGGAATARAAAAGGRPRRAVVRGARFRVAAARAGGRVPDRACRFTASGAVASAGRGPRRGHSARHENRPASSEFLSRGVRRRMSVLSCVRFCGGREAVRVWAGGGASVAGPRGRVALPRALPSGISNAVGFWPKPRAERPRAARQAVGVELWTLSTCGATIALILCCP